MAYNGYRTWDGVRVITVTVISCIPTQSCRGVCDAAPCSFFCFHEQRAWFHAAYSDSHAHLLASPCRSTEPCPLSRR